MARPAPTLLLAVSLLNLPGPAGSELADQVSTSSAPRSDAPVPLEEVGIPFGCGMSFPVSQAHNVGSHVGNDAWAWDFRMPEGTPVVAALDGVVRLARGDSDEGGCDPALAPRANYVVLEHGGNLETQYLHFAAVTVTPGQRVNRGDLLGYSGKTGWACGAHLHFKVATPVSASWNNPSVEARLAGFGDPALESSISSPRCSAPPEVARKQPALDPHAPAGFEPRAAAQPAEHPLSAGGSPLTLAAAPRLAASRPGPELPAASPVR